MLSFLQFLRIIMHTMFDLRAFCFPLFRTCVSGESPLFPECSWAPLCPPHQNQMQKGNEILLFVWLCLALANYFCLHCLRKEIAKRQRKQERLNVDLGTYQGPDDL